MGALDPGVIVQFGGIESAFKKVMMIGTRNCYPKCTKLTTLSVIAPALINSLQLNDTISDKWVQDRCNSIDDALDLGPSCTNPSIYWHRSGSTWVQVMAWCLVAPSHYLNQCWLIINGVLWPSAETNFLRKCSRYQFLKSVRIIHM